MYPSGPWPLKILIFALLVTHEIATYSTGWMTGWMTGRMDGWKKLHDHDVLYYM
jgi:hypothetical protein